MPPVLPAGHLRTMSYATLVNTVGAGMWAAGLALFLTRGVGLPAVEVGLGLSVARLVGLVASVPLGHLADRRDPRALRAAVQAGQAVVTAAFLLVDSFGTFLLVAVLDAGLQAGNLSLRAALVATVGGPAGRIRAFATLRAVANLGIGVGAGLAAVALAVDTRAAYAALVLANALTYLASAALLMRLPAFPPAGEPVRGPGAAVRALRDRGFLAVTAASAVLFSHRAVLVLIVPLWIVARTSAPRWVVSVVLVTNTALTVLLAVRLSRGADTAGPAARVMRRSGVVLAAAMLLYGATGDRSPAVTVGLLVLATIVYTVGDLLHATAAVGLSYDLAPPGALGQYQGVTVLLSGLAEAVAPAVLTILLVGGGGPSGWVALGVVFLAVGAVLPALTRWAGGPGARAAPGDCPQR